MKGLLVMAASGVIMMVLFFGFGITEPIIHWILGMFGGAFGTMCWFKEE